MIPQRRRLRRATADIVGASHQCFKGAMRAFAKSVLLGTVAGAAPPCAVTFVIALALSADNGGKIGLFPLLWVAFLPVVVTFPLVLGASIVFGLPLTALLKRLHGEAGATYVFFGTALGFLIALAILLVIRASDGYWTAALGAFSGAVTAHTWWRSAREPNASGRP